MPDTSERPLRGLVFDFGETLAYYEGTQLNWSEHYRQALQEVASACALKVDEGQLSQGEAVLSRYNTRTTPRTEEVRPQQIFDELINQWAADRPQLATPAERAFFGYFQRRLTVYPEVPKALSRLQAAGVPLSLFSNVPYGMSSELFRQDLHEAALDDYFVTVLTSVEVGHRKPAPEGLLRASQELGIPPRQLGYVGNEQKDVLAANAAGFTSILVARQDRRGIRDAAVTIKSLAELPTLCA